jgi:hypothetical protein
LNYSGNFGIRLIVQQAQREHNNLPALEWRESDYVQDFPKRLTAGIVMGPHLKPEHVGFATSNVGNAVLSFVFVWIRNETTTFLI